MTFVLVPPDITPIALPSGISSGDNVAITCVIKRGDEPIHISWMLNGHVLTEDQVRIVSTPLVSTVIIDSITREQAGNYTCRATNDAGTAHYTTHVAVLGQYSYPSPRNNILF